MNVERMELKISKFLRLGVIFCGILIAAGWMLNFKWRANPFDLYSYYDRIPLTSLIAFYYKKKNWGALLCYAGLIALICLPLIRVMLTAWLFMRQKEKTMARIAMVVLIALIVSFSLGIEL